MSISALSRGCTAAMQQVCAFYNFYTFWYGACRRAKHCEGYRPDTRRTISAVHYAIEWRYDGGCFEFESIPAGYEGFGRSLRCLFA